MPEISIGIPVYNGVRYLAETIRSIQDQSFTDWELNIVDDGSKDDTLAMARQIASTDPRIRVTAQPNGGVSAARNHLVRLCDPESLYFILIDQDDLWLPDALQRLVAALQRHSESPAAHGESILIDDQGAAMPPAADSDLRMQRVVPDGGDLRVLSATEPTALESLLMWNPIYTPGCVMMRRSALDEAGDFRTDLQYVGDWTMWIALARQGPLAYVAEPVIKYRLHGEQASRSLASMTAEGSRVRREIMQRADLTPAQRRTTVIGYRAQEKMAAVDKVSLVRWAAGKRDLRLIAQQTRHLLGHAVRGVVGQP